MSGHYYTKEPSTSGKTTTIRTFQLGNSLAFKSQSGIFGWNKVDTGSELLLNSVILPESGLVLDLGSGYGLIGVSLAKANPHLKFILTDINNLAIKYSKINCEINDVLENTEVRDGDLYESVQGMKFDVILSNPPLMAGKQVLNDLVNQSVNYLKDQGSLSIVVPKRKGLQSMQNLLKEVFGSYEVLAKKSGFWVMKAHI